MNRDKETNRPDDGDGGIVRDLEALPRSIEPPADWWPEVRARLTPRRMVLALPLWRRAVSGSLRLAAVLAALLVGARIGTLLLRSQASWRVAALTGAPRLAEGAITGGRSLPVGDWLTTDDTSRVTLDVGRIGSVEVEANSRVRLLKARPTEQRLALERGRIRATISAPPRLFFVETPSALAVDLGCAYTLEVDEHGNSVLVVTAGWVSFGREGREALVPAGTRALTRAGQGVGTPYADDAPEALRRALIALDFEHGGDSALGVVLREARRRDAITLWHLLSRLDSPRRGVVYDRLAALAPPPPEVTREEALHLDPIMLRLWWEKLPGTLVITPDWTRTLWRVWLKLTDW